MPSPTSDPAAATPTVLRALRARAGACPDAIALDGGRRMTAAQLHAAVEDCAAELRTLATPVVAWQLDDDWRWVVLDLACARARKVALPLPRFFTRSQSQAALAAAGCGLLVVPAGAAAAGTGSGQLVSLGADTHATGVRPRPVALPAGTAKITFTSGSTGDPKGVCLSQALLERVALALNRRLGERAAGCHLGTLPLAILLENVAGLYRCLLAGGRYVLPGADARALSGSSGFDPARLALAATRHDPELLIATPQMLAAMVAHGDVAAFRRPGFVAVGGAPLPPDVLARARAAGIAAYEGYGLSECGSVVALNVPGDDRPGTVGRPLPHLAVALRGDELTVAGATFLGYLGEPPRALGPVATGDLADIDEDGRITIVGRRGNLIVTPMGRNVAPEWVESELAAVLRGRRCCVTGDADGLTAIVEGTVAAPATITAAVAQANRALPDYARVARWVAAGEAFGVDNACLTANGRLRRPAIRARAARGVPVEVPAPDPAAAARTSARTAATGAAVDWRMER